MREVAWRRENKLFREVFTTREEEVVFKNFRDVGRQSIEVATNDIFWEERKLGVEVMTE